jgi:hypothetical protein
VLCQKLPFRSGYHSPLFADFVAPHRRVLSRLALQPARAPVWSATTCRPYPAAAEEIRQLAVDHLVQPVRFRELTEALYAEGVRVFLQVGTGSLVGFVGDTLKGRPHLAVGANLPNRSGLAQLRRVAAALFVEGQGGALEKLDRRERPQGAASARKPVSIPLSVPLLTPTQPLEPAVRGHATLGDAASPLAAELASSMRELASARDDVMAAFARRSTAEVPSEATFRRRISVESHPELCDHTFYRQPAGWPVMEDRYPVVPMTMLMELMMDAARELVPHKIPIALEGVRAARWLAVAPPIDVGIVARYDGVSRVDVAIRGYATGVVELGSSYPAAPDADTAPIASARPAPISAAELYGDRWMFHGPAYQGVVDVGVLGEDGIRGTLTSLAAKGGLLDNAGQLLGYWVMQHANVDRLAMPVHIASARFFGPEPAPGARLSCTIRVRELTDSGVRADVELAHAGRVWVSIEGWADRRFDSDARVWDLLTFPEKNTVTVMRPEGFGWLEQPWRASASRDLLARRYLNERERAAHREAGPRQQTDWLLERIAIKDCVRRHLWDRGHGPIFPIEVEVEQEGGAWRVRAPGEAPLHVAVAHDGAGVAVARVSSAGPVGIHVVRAAADEAGEQRREVTRILHGGPDGRHVDFAEVGEHLVGWTCT